MKFYNYHNHISPIRKFKFFQIMKFYNYHYHISPIRKFNFSFPIKIIVYTTQFYNFQELPLQ